MDYEFGIHGDDQMMGAQQVLFHKEGKCEWHNFSYPLHFAGAFAIKEKWYDSEGDVWYKQVLYTDQNRQI